MNKLKIAIDGWSSCGKSTLAKQIAKTLGYTYIDSGAMYRAITLYFMRNEIDATEPDAIHQALSRIELKFKKGLSSDASDMCLNGENVEEQIRSMSVAHEVSKVAAIKEIRDFAVHQQKEMGKEGGVVMDGRDIGTVVFPDADVKLFITASPEIRAQRRYKELMEKGMNVSMDEVIDNLKKRDHIDSTRTFSPLIQANDALVIDNSEMSMDGQLVYALDLIRSRINPSRD
jgi:cytidylate kinase